MDKTLTPGLAVICNMAGTVAHILRDDLGLTAVQPILGRPITALVDPNDLPKALNFLLEIKNQQAAFEWELTVKTPDGVFALQFGGVLSASQLFIVAAKTDSQLIQLYEELMLINNEQINTLRETLKKHVQLAQKQAAKDNELYQEISRINNEMVNLQRELAKKNAELLHLNQQKNLFLGMASHDLLNPLTVVLAYSETLKQCDSVISDDEAMYMVSEIQQSSIFMLSLIRNFLDLSAIEAGKLKLQPAPTDLLALMEHNVLMNQVLAGRKEIKLTLTPPQQPIPRLMMDARQIEQVLNNFISNGIKFSHPGSTIEIKLERRDDDVVVSVRDEGQGIPAEEMADLFEPFQTTSVRGTSAERSRGLGLAIARIVVEAHRGSVWASSTVGQGSTFFFSLPLDSAETAASQGSIRS